MVQRTGASQFTQRRIEHHRRLAPVADRALAVMRSFLFTFPLLVAMLISQKMALAEDYAGFAQLPEIEKDRIVWNLYDRQQWGKPEQKPICRDLLRTQGYSFANAIAWTTGAIDLAEKQAWSDLNPLISKIYERPKNIWVYERAFRYLRAQAGKPVSTNLIAAANTLQAAGGYGSSVSDAEMSLAKEHLSQEPDKETVLVYALKVAAWHAGKGATERGRKAAADVLRGLDRVTVAQRIRHLRQDCPDYMRSEVDWVAQALGISLQDGQK